MTRFESWTDWFLRAVVGCLILTCVSAAQTNLEPPQSTIPDAFFGMHIHGIAVPRPYTGKLTAWPSVKVGSWRLLDAYVKWSDLEPQPGKWEFQRLDKYVDVAQQHSVDILLPLLGSPDWASAGKGKDAGIAPPKNMEDWRVFVRTVATRYKGRIHTYEIWNEPNWPTMWSGTTQQLLDLTREAYVILKQVDPSIAVVSPSATTSKGVSWLDGFLRLGGGRYVDMIGFHLYVYPSPPEALIPLARQIESVMHQYGIGNKPLWDTEVGWVTPKPMPSDEVAAGFIMRAQIVAWAAGISRQYWYSWDNHNYALQVVDSQDEHPTAAGQAYAQVEQWLAGGRMTSCRSNNGVWVVDLFTADRNHPSKIVWSEAPAPRSFHLPDDWRVSAFTDFRGEEHPVKGRTLEIGPVPLLVQ